MKTTTCLIALALFAMAPLASATTTADKHAHDHSHQAAAAAADATDAPAQRHAVDAPLQAGMGKIRSAVEGLAHHEMGHLERKQVLIHAQEIEDQVQYLIANCKLDAKADAALHGIIGRLLAGASALKAKPADAAPVAKLRDALADYPRLFDDPNWPQAVK